MQKSIDELCVIFDYLRNRCIECIREQLQDHKTPNQIQLRLLNPYNAIFLPATPAQSRGADFLTSILIDGSEIWFTTQYGQRLSQNVLNVETLLALCTRLSAKKACAGNGLFNTETLFVLSPDQNRYVCTGRNQFQLLYNELTIGYTRPLTVRVNTPRPAMDEERMADYLTIQLEIPISDIEIVP